MESGQNAPKDSQRRDSTPGARNQIPPNLYFWWLIFAGLMIWNLFSLWPRQQTVAEIPYSNFLSQLRTGNMSQVHIVGDSISGKFAKAILWPPPEEGGQQMPNAAFARPHLHARNRATTDRSRTAEFHTTFPAAVGDPGLMPLLEAHNVIVDVSPSSTPWFLGLLIDWFPMLLLIGFFWWMARRASQNSVWDVRYRAHEGAPLQRRPA